MLSLLRLRGKMELTILPNKMLLTVTLLHKIDAIFGKVWI